MLSLLPLCFTPSKCAHWNVTFQSHPRTSWWLPRQTFQPPEDKTEKKKQTKIQIIILVSRFPGFHVFNAYTVRIVAENNCKSSPRSSQHSQLSRMKIHEKFSCRMFQAAPGSFLLYIFSLRTRSSSFNAKSLHDFTEKLDILFAPSYVYCDIM